MPEKIRINGTMKNRLPGNANVSFEGADASEVIFKLDEKIYVFQVDRHVHQGVKAITCTNSNKYTFSIFSMCN